MQRDLHSVCEQSAVSLTLQVVSISGCLHRSSGIIFVTVYIIRRIMGWKAWSRKSYFQVDELYIPVYVVNWSQQYTKKRMLGLWKSFWKMSVPRNTAVYFTSQNNGLPFSTFPSISFLHPLCISHCSLLLSLILLFLFIYFIWPHFRHSLIHSFFISLYFLTFSGRVNNSYVLKPQVSEVQERMCLYRIFLKRLPSFGCS
jgi:hypothetical protein